MLDFGGEEFAWLWVQSLGGEWPWCCCCCCLGKVGGHLGEVGGGGGIRDVVIRGGMGGPIVGWG